MTDPRRLLEGGDEDLGATLLRAGRVDAAPETSRKRAAAALGLTGTAGFGAAGASGGGAATVAKLAGAGAALKWLGAGVAGVVMVGAVSSYRATRLEPARGAVSVAAAAPRVRASSRLEIPPPEPIAPPPAMPALVAAPPASSPLTPPPPLAPAASSPVAHSVGREVALLDGARNALAAGDASDALHRLDGYAHAFPGGTGALALEASVVRVEALASNGDEARASILARQLLARHPDAPQAARLRSIVRELQSETDPTNP